MGPTHSSSTQIRPTMPQTVQHVPAGMRWGRDDIWTLNVLLPGGEYDFKFVVQLPDSSVGQWEPGANRNIMVCPAPKTLSKGWLPAGSIGPEQGLQS